MQPRPFTTEATEEHEGKPKSNLTAEFAETAEGAEKNPHRPEAIQNLREERDFQSTS
jgi:hypothetical protein